MKKAVKEDHVWYHLHITDWDVGYGFGGPILPESRERFDESIMLNIDATFVLPNALSGQIAKIRFFVWDFDIGRPKDERRSDAGEMTLDRETQTFDLSLTMRLPALGPVATGLIFSQASCPTSRSRRRDN